MADYYTIVCKKLETLSDYERSRGKTPETYIMGVTIKGVKNQKSSGSPTQIDYGFGVGTQLVRDDVEYCLGKAIEAGLDAHVIAYEDAKGMISRNPSQAMIDALSEKNRYANSNYLGDDETPFTR